MSSSTCSSRDSDTCECHWNCDHGFKCDLTGKANVPTRRKREFTPDELKDDQYWMKRSRNNEAAKRSRERRRMEERLLEERARQLLRENEKLKAALSAIGGHGVGKETTYDTFMDYSPVRELSQDSYLRTPVDFPGADCTPHYALSNRCDFTSAYDSVLLPRMHGFAAASFPAVVNTHQRDRHLGFNGLGNGNVPSSVYNNLPYANTPRKWGHGHAHPPMNPNSAPFSQNGLVPGHQCPAGTTPSCTTHARMNETYVPQRSFVTEPKDMCKEMGTVRTAARASTSPLLPHKLRYKVKARHRAERALSSPGMPPYLQG